MSGRRPRPLGLAAPPPARPLHRRLHAADPARRPAEPAGPPPAARSAAARPGPALARGLLAPGPALRGAAGAADGRRRRAAVRRLRGQHQHLTFCDGHLLGGHDDDHARLEHHPTTPAARSSRSPMLVVGIGFVALLTGRLRAALPRPRHRRDRAGARPRRPVRPRRSRCANCAASRNSCRRCRWRSSRWRATATQPASTASSAGRRATTRPSAPADARKLPLTVLDAAEAGPARRVPAPRSAQRRGFEPSASSPRSEPGVASTFLRTAPWTTSPALLFSSARPEPVADQGAGQRAVAVDDEHPGRRPGSATSP